MCRFPAGHYCEDTSLHTLDNVICQQDKFKAITENVNTNSQMEESAPFRNPPDFMIMMVIWYHGVI